MSANIKVYMDPRLKAVAGALADQDGISLSEWFVRVAAEKLGRPELAVVPRKKMGRPRNDPILDRAG